MRGYLFLFALVFLTACHQESSILTKPNIILILTDDQGYGDLACHGNPVIQTPFLDKLSKESVRFTNFHVGTTCAPTRAGLMSGMHCNRVGAWHTVIGRSFLSTKYPTMATYLKRGGYRTGIFGKWHLGDNYPFRPQDRGFDEVLIHGGGGVGQTPDYWNNDYFDDTYLHNGIPRKFSGYCTDIWFDEALGFIEAATASQNPFFCYISTNSPHGPHHAPQKYIDPYQGNERVPNPNFYGQITNLDDNIGKLESRLAQLGLLDNTILLFMTDNGTAAGANLDKNQQVTKGYNAGMRGKKGSEYEGGHRVPLFIRFPEAMSVTPGSFDHLTNYTDLLPTILDLVNLALPTDYQFDGLSLKQLLTTGTQPQLQERIVIVDTQRKEFPEKWKNASVMQNSWRLVNNKELYDLSNDTNQSNNVIQEHPDIARRLSTAYEEWWNDLQPDFQQKNRIIIGSEKANPVLLTSHDWHTEQSPPWHQRHIREGLEDNGNWWLEIAEAGNYQIRLYRWPPYLQKTFHEAVPAGEEVDGGQPYLAGVRLPLRNAKINIQGKELESAESVEDTYFEFSVHLEEGPANLQTWLTDEQQLERGAYYVVLNLN